MRIACLQFAPQVGDVNNNLNRADAVLAKANPDDLKDLDLIVLPELAFTGYNFKSLNHISPFLEPQGSGVSALWARTTALKYDTNVIVGYPERVDVSAKWPTGPEYYNSAIVVNGDGETIANYRKSFLYAIDETWALEGDDGFFSGDILGLGNTAMGICMDLNPYRFEAPWRAFEFAYHIEAIQANLVIVTMAWLTREDGRHFTRMPEEPDIETLTYWVQRLEPLIRHEGKEEVIVVFCNRTGIEDDLIYAGTSSVVGIKDGEVKVYGILGRGVKDLLVVDTDQQPFAKLIQRSQGGTTVESPSPDKPLRLQEHEDQDFIITSRSLESNTTSPAQSVQKEMTPPPELLLNPRKTRSTSHRIQIPESRFKPRTVSQGTIIEDSPTVATPTCPSPTPFSHRPHIDYPATNAATDNTYPQHRLRGSSEQFPNDDDDISTKGSDSDPASPRLDHSPEKYFRSDIQLPLKSPMAFHFPDIYKNDTSDVGAPVPSSLVKLHQEKHHTGRDVDGSSMPHSSCLEGFGIRDQSEITAGGYSIVTPGKSMTTPSQDFARSSPSSPKSRNASRAGRQPGRRHSGVAQPDPAGTVERLELMARRPESAMESIHFSSERKGRPRTRKSSVTRVDQPPEQPYDKELNMIPPRLFSTTESSSILSDSTSQSRLNGYRSGERTKSRAATSNGGSNMWPHVGVYSRNDLGTGRGTSHSHIRSGSTGNARVRGDAKPHIEPDDTKTLAWSELSKMVDEVLDQQQSRETSRGRHRIARSLGKSSSSSVKRETHSESRAGPRLLSRDEQRLTSQARSDSAPLTSLRTILSPHGTNGLSSPYNSDDEIVAEIIFHPKGRTARSRISSPQGQATRASPSPTRAAPTLPRDLGREASRSKTKSYHSTSRPDRLGTSIRTGSNDSRPTLDAVSIPTTTSQKGAPTTPPPRMFEPTTPKAMKFDPESGTVLSSTPNQTTGSKAPYLDSLQQELMKLGMLRPEHIAWA